MSFITSAEKLAKSGFKITEKETALARRLDDATADILKGSEKLSPTTRKTLLESYQAFTNAAPEGTGKFQAARQYMSAARQAFPEGDAGDAAFKKFRTALSEEVRRAEGLDPKPKVGATEGPKAEAPKGPAAGGGKGGGKGPDEPTGKLPDGVSKYHNLTASQLQDRQRVLGLELERSLNAPADATGALSKVVSFGKTMFTRNAPHSGMGGGEAVSRSSRKLADILADLDELRIAPAYNGLKVGEDTAKALSPKETLSALKNGEYVDEKSYSKFNLQMAKGSLGKVNFIANNPMASAAIATVVGLTANSWYYTEGVPQPGYSLAQRLPLATFVVPSTWGNDKEQAEDLTIWALQKHPEGLQDPSSPFKQYADAVRNKDVDGMSKSSLSADQKKAVEFLSIEIDKGVIDSQAKKTDAEKLLAENQNKNLQETNQLKETELYISLGRESAININKEDITGKHTSRLSNKQALENAEVFYEAITQDDEYGLKDKKSALTDAFKGAAKENSFSLPEFKNQLERKGLSEKAVQKAVEVTRGSFEP